MVRGLVARRSAPECGFEGAAGTGCALDGGLQVCQQGLRVGGNSLSVLRGCERRCGRLAEELGCSGIDEGSQIGVGRFRDWVKTAAKPHGACGAGLGVDPRGCPLRQGGEGIEVGVAGDVFEADTGVEAHTGLVPLRLSPLNAGGVRPIHHRAKLLGCGSEFLSAAGDLRGGSED